MLAALLAPLGFLGDSFVALFLITGIESLLWLFGIHGPALLAAIVLPVYLNFQVENTAAFHEGMPLPHLVVVSTFMFVFHRRLRRDAADGAAACCAAASRACGRSRYATLLPSLINTNEPVMFGLPLVYNPVLGIPYLLAPLALVCTTYAALALHLVRAPIYYLPSTLPIFLNVFLATLDWRAIPLLLVNIADCGRDLSAVRAHVRSDGAGASRDRRRSSASGGSHDAVRAAAETALPRLLDGTTRAGAPFACA